MAGARKRSMLTAERIGAPSVNQISVAASSQRTADKKNCLGTGKNERNKGDSLGFREVGVI